LLKAALKAGNMNGESTYAQCLYCRDINEQNLFFEFGYTSLFSFTQAIWDWSQRKTREMLEIAYGLQEYPKLCEAFRQGRLSWTKARLLLRVLQPLKDDQNRLENDEKWAKKIHKSYRELEILLAQEYSPDDPKDWPLQYHARTKWVAGDLDQGVPGGKVQVSFELPPDLYLLWEKAINQTIKEIHEAPSQKDSKAKTPYHEVIGALSRRVLEAKGSDTKIVAPAEITLNQCSSCERTTVHSTQMGEISLSKDQEQRLSDSRHIPAAIYKKVLQKNYYHCAVPNCRNHLWLHIHHIKGWAEGGKHDQENLITLCGTHHRLLHDKKIFIKRMNGKLIFKNQFGEEMGYAHMSTYWPKPLNLQTLVSMPTKRDRSIAEAMEAEMLEEDANVSRETAPPYHEQEAKQRIKKALDDFYRDQTENRKDLIPGFRRYEAMRAKI